MAVIMLDEAHERTIHTDVLFSLMKKAAVKRPGLKLIVTSATMEAEKYSEYFNKCPVFTVPGRTYPVEVLYCKAPESDYLDAALITVMQIHLAEPPGDVLLFLTGQEEIDTACQILYERMKSLGKVSISLALVSRSLSLSFLSCSRSLSLSHIHTRTHTPHTQIFNHYCSLPFTVSLALSLALPLAPSLSRAHTHTHTQTHIRRYMHTSLHKYIDMCIYAYAHTSLNTHMRACEHMYMYIYVYVCIYICIFTHTFICVYMHTYKYICIRKCIHIVYILYISIYKYMFIYICMYHIPKLMYACMQTRTAGAQAQHFPGILDIAIGDADAHLRPHAHG